MSKFTAAIQQQPKQIKELQQTAAADLPAGTPAPAPADTKKRTAAQGSLMSALTAPGAAATTPAAEAVPESIQQDPLDAGAENFLDVSEEAARHQVPGLVDRKRDTTTVHRWLRPISSANSQNPDGGLGDRARSMADAMQNGQLYPASQPKAGSEAWKLSNAGKQVEAAAVLSADKEGSLSAALHRSGALQPNPSGKLVPSVLYAQVASAVTENMVAELSLGDGETVVDPISQALGEDADTKPKPKAKEGEPPQVSKAQGNARLGQQIHLEFQRTQGNKVPDQLPQREAETLGDAFKELWAANAGRDIVNRFTGTDGQVYFQLTSQGQEALRAGAQERKRLFPKPQARPSKTPLPAGELPGDVGQNVVKTATGKVGEPKFGARIEEAKRNLATVPNVVDKQRAKILFSTVLPVLQSGDHSTWMAEINNFGPSKLKKYAAAKRDQEMRMAKDPDLEEEVYNPEKVMGDLTDKIAQEVRAVAQERKGANYLTYTTQAFNGRIAPNQTFFDPTSSKAVRFVTRNAVPARATPGSRIDKNLRQMYAMMLVGETHKLPALRDDITGKFIKADALLPAQRDLALDAAAPQLEQWGDRLTQALVMTDEQYEAIAQAIESGAPLDQNFPEIPQLALDEQADAELIQAIKDKGEDGPHFIDGLIDFAKYNKARKKGQPYHSYFNAYIDGKTNGLASNGIQMGHLPTAAATGVVRKNVRQLLDEGDLRDQLKNLAVSSIADGWDASVSEYESELNDVAENLFSYRDFNKGTTMTFGYGKEIQSFKKDIEDHLSLLAELAPEGNSYISSLAVLDEKVGRDDLAQLLLNKYEQSLREVLSDDAIENRGLMRGAAILHAATNKLFSIKSYTGMDINLGRGVHGGRDNATKTDYRIYGEGKPIQVDAFHYETEATSAAVRTLHGDDVPGEYAYGGSLPGPVQSLDAATVAMTSSGKSWDKLKNKSMGNPYLHTIYDAFKMDAMGYDTVLEEVNKNWFDAASQWSYLDQTLQSTSKAMKEWNESIKGKPNNTPLTANERVYMDWMLEAKTTSKGDVKPMNYIKKMSKVLEGEGDEKFNAAWNKADELVREMKKAGYDFEKPPLQPTIGQLKVFVKHLFDDINLRPRLTKAINETNAGKKEIRRELQKRGYKTPSGEMIALQYYAH